MSSDKGSPETSRQTKKCAHTLLYIAVIAFCIVCAAVYIFFSHGKSETAVPNSSDSLQQDSTANIAAIATEPYDSAALHLALMPTKDCLPILYAEETGIFRKIGLDVQLKTYSSQLDCDTALAGHYADGGFTDALRLSGKRLSRTSFTVLAQSHETWQLVVCGSLRIKGIENLQGRNIAIARQTAEESMLDDFLRTTKMKNDQVLRPLINDMQLRAEMLNNNQIDAAMLRWPYASYATSMGHKVLHTFAANDKTCSYFVMKTKPADKEQKKEQLRMLARGYAMAVDSIRNNRRSALVHVLEKHYSIPQSVGDTLRIPLLRKDYISVK